MSIEILAGDFKTGPYMGDFMLGSLTLRSPTETGWLGAKLVNYTPDQIEELELATEDNVKRLGGTVGWGAAGAVILGPVGLLAGLLLGGRGKNVTFVCKLKDGKKFLGTAPAKTYKALMAATFK